MDSKSLFQIIFNYCRHRFVSCTNLQKTTCFYKNEQEKEIKIDPERNIVFFVISKFCVTHSRIQNYKIAGETYRERRLRYAASGNI